MRRPSDLGQSSDHPGEWLTCSLQAQYVRSDICDRYSVEALKQILGNNVRLSGGYLLIKAVLGTCSA